MNRREASKGNGNKQLFILLEQVRPVCLLTNNLPLSATVLFHIKISKTITSCAAIGGSTRCDAVSIVLLSVWKILLMLGVRGGLTDPNWPNSSGHISLSQAL